MRCCARPAMSLYIAPQIPPREARVCVWRLGWVCSADCQSAVSQDAILQDCALAGICELRKRPADWQSATQQINNLRYAEQIRARGLHRCRPGPLTRRVVELRPRVQDRRAANETLTHRPLSQPISSLLPERRPWYRVLYVQVLIAVAVGIVFGRLFPDLGKSFKPLGDGFIKLVKMMIAPIVFCTVVHGIASMRDLKKLGRVGVKALLYFEVVSTLALAIGLVVVNVLKPGAGFNIDP